MLDQFPPSPIRGTHRLVPIRRWTDLERERRITGVEYGMFWDEAVHDGVAYFFRWLGTPRATLLAVFDDRSLLHVESRKSGDKELSSSEAELVHAEIRRRFRVAGFRGD